VIRHSCLEECLAGAVMLCGPDLERVIHREHLPLRFKSGNNCSIRSIDTLFSILWENDGEYSPACWWSRPCVALYRRCCQMIMTVFGRDQLDAWKVNFRRHFISTHWVLPYPLGSALPWTTTIFYENGRKALLVV
jgi:hypothetical protein